MIKCKFCNKAQYNNYKFSKKYHNYIPVCFEHDYKLDCISIPDYIPKEQHKQYKINKIK